VWTPGRGHRRRSALLRVRLWRPNGRRAWQREGWAGAGVDGGLGSRGDDGRTKNGCDVKCCAARGERELSVLVQNFKNVSYPGTFIG
jgi:hypothetical protein